MFLEPKYVIPLSHNHRHPIVAGRGRTLLEQIVCVNYVNQVMWKMSKEDANFTETMSAILSTSNRIPTRGQSQIGSHVYFLLIIAMVILL